MWRSALEKVGGNGPQGRSEKLERWTGKLELRGRESTHTLRCVDTRRLVGSIVHTSERKSRATTTRQCFEGTGREIVQFPLRLIWFASQRFIWFAMLLRLVLLTLAITVIQVTAIKQPRSIPKYTEWRLPRWVLPRHYKLRLLPFIEDGNFTTAGQVEILLECMEPTKMIVLHIADIRIVKDEGLQVNKAGISLFGQTWYSGKINIWQVHDLIESRRVPIQSYIEDKTRQLLVIGTKNETLQVGKYYKLSIRFIGQLNDKLNGFYRASYTENGIKK